MSRSKWKGPYVDINGLEKLQTSKKAYLKTPITRNSTILPKFLEKNFIVYNGKNFTEIVVTEEMIGYKFGEFSFTRKRFAFKKKKTKK